MVSLFLDNLRDKDNTVELKLQSVGQLLLYEKWESFVGYFSDT